MFKSEHVLHFERKGCIRAEFFNAIPSSRLLLLASRVMVDAVLAPTLKTNAKKSVEE